MYRDAASQITTRWEYMMFTAGTNSEPPTPLPQVTTKLDRLGAEGWELVSFAAPNIEQMVFAMKRQIM